MTKITEDQLAQTTWQDSPETPTSQANQDQTPDGGEMIAPDNGDLAGSQFSSGPNTPNDYDHPWLPDYVQDFADKEDAPAPLARLSLTPDDIGPAKSEPQEPAAINDPDNKGDSSLNLSQQSKKRRNPVLGFLKFMFMLGLLGGIVGAGAAVSLIMWASQDLPSFSKIADYNPPQVTTVLARDGTLIGQLYQERRFLISLEDMAETLPLAFMAIEDDDFYYHFGIDIKAIIRATLANLRSGRTTQGASTITQQVIKRLMLTPEQTYERKIKEMILACRLETQLSKDDILTLYLNQIFLGNNSYGVEAAARTYFAKHAKDLNLAESAMLAGLAKSPSAYNPLRNPEQAQQRQRVVLRRMRDLAWITEDQYEQALYYPLEYKSMPSGMGREGGWYLEEVRRQLVDMFSEENAGQYGFNYGLYGEDAVYQLGLTVHTSMEPFQQYAGDAALRQGLEEATKRHGWLGPLANLDPSEIDSFLIQHPFSLQTLERGGWLQVLVTSVEKNGATVRIGPDYKGYVSVKTMGWARTPNKRVAGDQNSSAVNDATKVLKDGDVIWVSFWKEAPANNGEFKLSELTTETVIPLRLQQYPDVQGALVSIEPQTGDVVALVGGYEFGYHGSQFNRATQAQRQPGSAFKPIVYSASLEHGFTASSMVLDAPIMIINEWTREAWRPRNFEGSFEGPMRLNRALARSRNLCTVRVVQQMGIDPVIDLAKALGLTPHFPREMAISLGAVAVSPINLTQAYTAFANAGQVSTPRLIQSIQGAWGNTIYEKEPELRQVISPENAYVMASMLKDVINMGTGTRAKVLERPIGGKTGSTNEENDAWFLGITPYLVTGIYVGHDQIAPMGRGETGSGAALPIYVIYGKTALEAYEPQDFVPPTNIIFAAVDGMQMPFMPGTQPGTGYGRNALNVDSAAISAEGEDLLREMF